MRLLVVVLLTLGLPLLGTTGRETEWGFQPKTLEIRADTDQQIVVENSGTTDHDFVIDGVVRSAMTAPHRSATVTLHLRPGTYTFYCDVPGHRQLGMVGTVVVK